MKKIGNIDISFSEYKNGVYYYSFVVEMQGVTREIMLPRYHPFVGWIEAFGLPPQNQWVVLTNVDAFATKAHLIIDEEKYDESFMYTPDAQNKTHTIEIVRENNGATETMVWFEEFKNAPQLVHNTMTFNSKAGEYICKAKAAINTPNDLTGEELRFVDGVISKRGATEHIWTKSFASKGIVPEMYYAFFPQIEGVDLTDVQGTVIEVGYMAGDDAVDAVHGDWFKRFQLGDHIFYMNEHSYTSTTVETEHGPEKIKNTYCCELFKK